MSQQYPMTMNGKKLLDDELEKLIKIDREEVKKAIQEAREHGDLKENAEYHSAKEKQSMIEGRIADLQNKIGNAQIVDVSKIKSNKVVFGAVVTVLHVEKDEEITFQIVGEDEAQSDKSKISYNSPLGKSLIGREEGDEVIVKAPKGNIEYQIVSLKY
jgi:transcription elongation factor GreA